MKLRNLFTSGKMNKDLDERLVPKGEYRNALNVRVSNSNGSDVGALENALSNSKVTSLDLGLYPKTIGVVSDDMDGTIYWCVKSENRSSVCEYNSLTGESSIIISDNRSKNILNFDYNMYVDMSIINDGENGKKYLFFVDGKNEPKYFNIDYAKNLYNNDFELEDVSLIKSPPLNAPSISLVETNNSENNIKDKFYSFSYRYIYTNNEISAMSPFSEFGFLPSDFRYDYNSGNNKSMFNDKNKVSLSINTGSKRVKQIEVIAKESDTNAYYIVEKIDKEDKSLSDNASYTFDFTNNKVFKALDITQTLRVYDNVPLSAESVEIIGNRVLLSNYLDGYNMVNGDDKIYPKISVSKNSVSGTSGLPHTTLKSNRDYEIGISYLDGKGRMTTPFTSEDNSVHVPFYDSDKKNTLSVSISSKAPEWATNYRFFVKQSRDDYDVISPVSFYKEGVYAWIRLEGEDINKVKKGDFLFLKSDTSGLKKEQIRVKVLDANVKERNFLEDSSEENTIQEGGNYIKVDTEGISLDETSIDTFTYEGYAFRSRNTYNNVINPQDYVENTVFYGSGTDNINVTGSYNHPSDLRYEVKVISSGSPDSVQWRFLDCRENIYSAWDDNNGLGYSTASTISIGNGLSISFSSSSGHQIDDRWVINAKSYDRPKSWDNNDDSSAGDDGRRAIMHFKTSESGSESIKAGSIITLEYDDTPSEEYGNPSGYVYQRFISSSDYENLEEWFWEDDVISIMDYPEDLSDIMFRRGFLQKANGEQIRIDPTGDLYLMMLSQSNYLGGGRVRVDINLKVLQIDNPIIFETDYKNSSNEVFYEMPYTYSIDSNGNHLGDVNQVFGITNAVVNLDYFNAFGWYNGYESIKIADAFNETKMLNDSKPLVPVDDYKQVKRTASMTYSAVYESTTSYNGVNEFNLSTANYKDLDINFGSIKKVVSRDGDVIVFQNNRVSRVLFSKNVLYNADGSGNLQASNNILGQDVPYSGEYGILNNPYSVAAWGNNIYFTDERRRESLRLNSSNGIFPITQYGMRSWFNDNVNTDTKIISTYDPFNDQYVLNVKNETVEWLEDTYYCSTFEWLDDTYYCSTYEWLEDTYDCVQATTTTTTLAPTTTTTTQPAGTTTTTTTQAPVGSYTCARAANWVDVSYNPNTEAISVTPLFGSVTVHSYNPTTSPNNSGVVSITYVISDSNPDWDNTNEQLTCGNISVDTTVTTTTTTQATTTTTTTTTEATTTTTTTTAAPTTTTTTAAPTTTTTTVACYRYVASVPSMSGESQTVVWIDCDGVEQSRTEYWTSGGGSFSFCAREIIGADYPVDGPNEPCG